MDFSLNVFKQLPSLAALAQAGVLFQAAGVLTASASVNACFALFNNNTNGLPIWLFSARVQATVAMEFDLYRMDADPALSAGNAPVNALLGERPAGATFEAQAIAAPAAGPQFGVVEATPQNQLDMLFPNILCIPPGRGIMVISALVAGKATVNLTWAEIPAGFSDYLAEREPE